MILFADATVRRDSRTKILADYLLDRLGGEIETVKLISESLPVFDEKNLELRTFLSSKGDFTDEMFRYAVQFSKADEIVFAVPFWDMSFPAVFKKYIESVCVCGLTFKYSDCGIPVGLCRAKRMFYVSTAGGPTFGDKYGYEYVKALCTNMFGISDCTRICAENLDIDGADVHGIMEDTRRKTDDILMQKI